VNSAYPTLAYYGGASPWTSDAISAISVPTSPGTSILYLPEQWAANIDSNNMGLSVFVPSQYPYELAISFPGSGGTGPTGDATYYQHPVSVATIGPGAVIEGDVYIIPGGYVSARGVVYGLHQLLRASDIFPPLANVDTPAVNATISGNAVYGSSRPDVAAAYPHATAQCGWTFSLDSTQLTNGAHTITIHATDASNNEAILAPI